MMVLEFPFDRNKTNTFATTTFAAQQDMADFTVCFAFKVNALKSAILDQMQLLQIQDIDGETLAEIVLDVEYDEETFQKTSFGLSSTGFKLFPCSPFCPHDVDESLFLDEQWEGNYSNERCQIRT